MKLKKPIILIEKYKLDKYNHWLSLYKCWICGDKKLVYKNRDSTFRGVCIKCLPVLKRKCFLSKTQLIKYYHKDNLSTQEIANKINTTSATIYNHLKKNNIKLKKIGYHRKNKIIPSVKYSKEDLIKMFKDCGVRPKNYDDVINTTLKINLECIFCGFRMYNNLHSISKNAKHNKLHRVCANCNKQSTGERWVCEKLIENKVPYIRFVSFDDLKHKRKLIYDGGILNRKNILIHLFEYHGTQHYIKTKRMKNKVFTNDEATRIFNNLKHRDKIKVTFARKINIPLTVINDRWTDEKLQQFIEEQFV